MEGVLQLLDDLRETGQTAGRFRGLLNVLIGRRITRRADGVVITSGYTWRELAAHLKKARWEKNCVRELGLDPADLPPRDRERYWYSAIAQARVDSAEAFAAGDEIAAVLNGLGYDVTSAAG